MPDTVFLTMAVWADANPEYAPGWAWLMAAGLRPDFGRWYATRPASVYGPPPESMLPPAVFDRLAGGSYHADRGTWACDHITVYAETRPGHYSTAAYKAAVVAAAAALRDGEIE